ncbi:cell wall hydrolase [Novosphingobium bradum]|uniref:Cell wall hydrolase n=1 Tax=Novosphingobium bradum TaxID=1737444 RepID=A0ABV7IU44_9SPHN
MSFRTKFSSAVIASLAFVLTIAVADGSGAAAQNRTPQIASQASASASGPDNLLPASYPAPLANPAPNPADADLRPSREEKLPPPIRTDANGDAVAGEAPAAPITVPSLTRAVTPVSADLPRELECLAGAIYFEAKSESLEGQLAVGRVVINRARSGRFPASYCGVVFQRSQFSFIRGGQMPAINRVSRTWQQAVAIAKIADANAYPSPAEGALFFHATSVSPNWRLTRVARVDNHVFYR